MSRVHFPMNQAETSFARSLRTPFRYFRGLAASDGILPARPVKYQGQALASLCRVRLILSRRTQQFNSHSCDLSSRIAEISRHEYLCFIGSAKNFIRRNFIAYHREHWLL